MKKPPFLEAVRVETERAREELAAVAFDLKPVREAVLKAAGEGLEEVRIVVPGFADLRATKAAQELTKYLRDCGFAVEWEHRILEEDGRTVSRCDLVVAWRAGL